MANAALKKKVEEDSNSSFSLDESNIAFARRLAQRFYSKRAHSQAEIEDIVSSAYLGLCEAATRYEDERSGSFNTFSYLRIVGSMYDYLRSSGGVSRYDYNNIFQNEDSSKESKRTLRFASDISELENMKSAIEDWGVSVNVDKDNGCVDITYVDQELPEAEVIRESVNKKLRSAMAELPEEMQMVLRGRYFEGKTLEEMSQDANGISKSQLSRLHSRALLMLRSKMAEYVSL
ncbi:MAG TPA: sigma-70 family RNA polymerase sigma factor [Oligoflexia bacterium]|nr:sigma-70 family RNA polymerase sigma factor [Oligoflexia bacterium]HMP48805.1 sigma-70 family RNA polymerase sigma factor [Oligoflexia bacterium]